MCVKVILYKNESSSIRIAYFDQMENDTQNKTNG